ncbi:GDNF family receptor alpha-2a [Colossoma macropomum]|uniref:GDNF family receptor alpha-2a n=1 Tax=Colossoma macropomum TaxID=42526 RepID=UPI001864723A|nr:GDNF family receptor alpha-2a [Colossoma macropomum]
MHVHIYGFLLLLDELVVSMSSSSALSASGPQDWVDCVKASEVCNQNPQCSSRYRIMRQCLVGKDWNTMLANKECQAALEVLQESPLYDCRCKRGMKKELQCLQSYWSINMGLSEGEDFYEATPYEPLPPVRHSDAFRLASITSGMQIYAGVGMRLPLCSGPGNCNPCLDATKACNLNDNCKRQRSAYISTCTRVTGQQGQQQQDGCNRKRCHKALRQFLERVESQYTFGLLFCACRDKACAERRRQTIVPSCAYEDKNKPNCLQLRKTCRLDALCRSRLADFHTNCQMTRDFISSCPNDDYQACLTAYTGLIGTEMTPNYENNNHEDFTISPWCTCQNSGNKEEECDKFLKDFNQNTCLQNAIVAFGYGMFKFDAPFGTPSANPEPSIEPKSTPSPNSTRAATEENAETCSPSKGFGCNEALIEPDTVVPKFNTRNWSPGLKLSAGVWMLWLIYAAGNFAI